MSAMNWMPRLASEDDIPALEELIPLSVRSLHAPLLFTDEVSMAGGLTLPVIRMTKRLRNSH